MVNTTLINMIIMSKFLILPVIKYCFFGIVLLSISFATEANARQSKPADDEAIVSESDSTDNEIERHAILPFMNIPKKNATSGNSVVSGDVLEKYPSYDIRNTFSGLIPGLRVREIHGSPEIHPEENYGNFGFEPRATMNLRGRNPIFIIDDIPTEITEIQIEQYEIESATVIKDIVGKTMFGPEAADGIIFLRTRRGTSEKSILKVNAEYGVNVADRFPNWTTGADYARLNNLARSNEGMTPLYSDNDIAAYAKNDPYDMYHPSINFKEMMMKNTMNMRKFNFSYEGRKEGVRFFTYLGYSGSDDLFKLGYKANYNRLNARSNIDVKLNDELSLHMNIFGGLTFRNSPSYYSGDLSKFLIMISDASTISPIAFPVYASTSSDDKFTWYGVDPSFSQNPIGALVDNGYYTEYGRMGTASASLVYDMKRILPGLKSKTFFSFDIFNLMRLGKLEQYAAYNVTPSTTKTGADTILLTKAIDGLTVANQQNLHDYYYQRFGGYQSFTYDKDFGNKNYLQAALTYYLSMTTRDATLQPERHQNGILSALYTYNGKYSLHGVLNFAGSTSLAPGHRYLLFPAVGASWIISEEGFFSGVSFINYLKLRGEIGMNGYDAYNGASYYLDRWTYNASGGASGPAPTGYWFGSDTEATKRSNPTVIGNPDFGWEKRKELSVGLDAALFDHKLTVDVSYYNNIRDGVVTNLLYTIPYVTGNSSYSFVNYEKYRYFGVESAIQYTDKIGDFGFSVGGNATVQNTKILKWDEPNYRFDYQRLTNKSLDSYRGLTYLGKFASDAETKIIPQLYDEVLQSGDLKYADLNGDGAVDDNDKGVIGHTSPRLFYGLNLMLRYKGFELTLVADGIAFVDLPLTNMYFRNGWGNNNYSEFVRDNIGGAYPRLTYYQVNNNFQSSDFWLTKGGYFKLQNAEFAYNLSPKVTQALHMKAAKVFVRGANLLTITNVKYVDPESVDAGVYLYPLFRTYTCGLKLTF